MKGEKKGVTFIKALDCENTRMLQVKCYVLIL